MKAGEYFNNGYSCSESMIKWAVDEGLVDENALSLATSFSGGMGSGCLCGAIVGAQMIIGSQFGRDNKFGNENIAREKAREFIQKFVEKHKVTCCKILTKNFSDFHNEKPPFITYLSSLYHTDCTFSSKKSKLLYNKQLVK